VTVAGRACRQLEVKVIDGTSHFALLNFK